VRLVLTRFRWLFATGDSRDAEILALRHQLLVLQRQIGRPRFNNTDRTLIIRLARENPNWGYRRVHGELPRLGHAIAASTVWKILRTAGIDPTRDRTGPSWSAFLRSQAKAIIATDFACVDTALLKRFHVLFVTEHATRRIHLAGITTNPTGPWTTQATRNLMMRLGDTQPFRFLIRDGAGQSTRSFDTVLAGSGIAAIRIPPRSPQANAFAERWVRTLRHEQLDRTIIWNETQLRHLLEEYIERYDTHRPHRSLHQRAPNDSGNVTPIGQGHPIQRNTTCSGLINEYHTAA